MLPRRKLTLRSCCARASATPHVAATPHTDLSAAVHLLFWVLRDGRCRVSRGADTVITELRRIKERERMAGPSPLTPQLRAPPRHAPLITRGANLKSEMRNQLSRTPAQRLTRTSPPVGAAARQRVGAGAVPRRPRPSVRAAGELLAYRRRVPRRFRRRNARAEEAHGERVAWLRGHEVVAARAAVGAHRVGEHAVDLRRDRIAAGAWRDCVWRDRERDGIAVGRGASGPRLGLSQTPHLVVRRRLDLGRSRILSLSDLDLVGHHRLCERVHGARKDATPPKRLRHPDVRHDEAAGVRGVPRAHGRGELQLEGDEDLLGLVPNRQLIRPRGGARPLQSA